VTVERVVEAFPIPADYRSLERRELPSGVRGRAPPANDCWTFYVHSFFAFLVHFGSWLSAIITAKVQENKTEVGKVTLLARISNLG